MEREAYLCGICSFTAYLGLFLDGLLMSMLKPREVQEVVIGLGEVRHVRSTRIWHGQRKQI